jgi:O-antigen/teichoic acid export membrane protein
MMRLLSQVFATKLVDYALKFFTNVMIARALGPSEKGVLTFAMLVTTWTVTFGNLSFYDGNIFLLGSRKFSVHDAAMTSYVLSLATGVAYALILFVLVYGQLVQWPVGRPDAFYVLLLTIPLSILLNNTMSIFQGLSEFRAYNIFTVVLSATLLTGVVIVTHTMRHPLLGVVWAVVVTSVVSAVGASLFLGRLAQWRMRFSFAYLREGLLYGLRGHLRVLLMLVTSRFDQFALGSLLQPAVLGWYSISAAMAEGLLLLPDSVGMLLFPKVAGAPQNAAGLTARACRCTLAVTFAAAAALVVAGKWFVVFVYGDQFAPAVLPMQILVVAIVFHSLSRVIRNFLYGFGRPQLSLFSTGAAALVSVTLMFPLVKHYGIIGAACATLVAHLAACIIDLLLTKNIGRVSFRELLIMRKSDLSALRPTL